MANIDLHNHGVIGFHPKWQKLQVYSGKNVLQMWADRCFEKGIDFCAVTSERDVPKISIGHYEDRINYLLDNYAKTLPKEYSAGKLGDNSFIVEKDGRKVIFMSGQTVVVREDDRRSDHLIFGSNQIENGKNWDYTLKSAKER